MKTKRIVLVEAFYGGSHKKWALGLQKHSQHNIEIISLPDQNWKWRMHGGAIEMAKKVNALKYKPDLILCTDMMDLALFKSLIKIECKIFLYFHENQLTYPWFEQREDISRKSDLNYAFINYSSALVADRVFFNSNYHQTIFLEAIEGFLKILPEPRNIETIDVIRKKSKCLYVGIDFKDHSEHQIDSKPIILWNHRWEYDKNPTLFFDSLLELKKENIDFGLIVLGEQSTQENEKIHRLQKELKANTIHWGYVSNEQEYQNLLSKCNIAPITSIQDFFGISLIESCHAGLYPIIPNRLAFPETIPFEQYFYKNDSDFLNTLKNVILEERFQQRQSSLMEYCNKYNWEILIKKYDLVLSE